MNVNKFKLCNFYLVIITIIFIAYINIIDVKYFLNNIITNSDSNFVSMQDVVIYTIYGLNIFSRITFIDIIRFSLPFLLCISFICAYLSNIIDNKNIYINLIRYRSYKSWSEKILLDLIVKICTFFFIYYFSIIIISAFYCSYKSGFTDTFIEINKNISTNISFFKLLIYQYLLSILFCINLTNIIFIISFVSNNVNKAFIYNSLLIIFISILGKYNLFNPIMLSKHNTINSYFIISPEITIVVNLLIYFITFYLLIKTIKILIRRYTL